jgi:hypothetical protein
MKKDLVDSFLGITSEKIEDLDDGHMKVLQIFSKHTFHRILDVGHGDGNFTMLLGKSQMPKKFMALIAPKEL